MLKGKSSKKGYKNKIKNIEKEKSTCRAQEI